MSDAPHTPAAFINAIAEEGSKKEAIEWLQKIWNERCQLERENEALRKDAESVLLQAREEGRREGMRECKWALDDEDSGTWRGDCGELWTFTEGGPSENNFNYCPACGGITRASEGK